MQRCLVNSTLPFPSCDPRAQFVFCGAVMKAIFFCMSMHPLLRTYGATIPESERSMGRTYKLPSSLSTCSSVSGLAFWVILKATEEAMSSKVLKRPSLPLPIWDGGQSHSSFEAPSLPSSVIQGHFHGWWKEELSWSASSSEHLQQSLPTLEENPLHSAPLTPSVLSHWTPVFASKSTT